jgi:CBS domain-containing protein
MSPEEPVTDYMTWVPQAVDAEQSVADARARMQFFRIGHLPVIDSGELVGVVSERELDALRGVEASHAKSMAIREFVRPQPCTVALEASIEDAIRNMVNMRSDCCVVLDGHRMVGILTSTDVMYVLAELLGSAGHVGRRWTPTELRVRIATEHAWLRRTLAEVQELAGRLDSGVEIEGALGTRCRDLHLTLIRHIELKNALARPALRTSPNIGTEFAKLLVDQHNPQIRTLLRLLPRLPPTSARELPPLLAGLAHELRKAVVLEDHVLKSDALNPRYE